MSNKTYYICPMDADVREDKPGDCPKCGMSLIEIKNSKFEIRNFDESKKHVGHVAISPRRMPFWQKLKMGMSMVMGMEHGGIAGREMAKLMEEDIRNKFFFSLLLSGPIVYFSLFRPIPWIAFLLTTPVFFFSGWIFLYSTYKALKAKTLNMAVLIAVGITAAYGFSVVLTLLGSGDSYYEAAALLITFVLFGHWMEMKSRRGTTDALQALFDLVPPQSRRLVNGKEELVPTSEIKVGDVLVLKPGDKVPVDGKIVEGETSIDESLVTGESMPVSKKIGDLVIGGSINQSGSVNFKATKVGEDTALAHIVKLVETAQNSKAPGQKIADKFAQYLVIVAVGGGLLTFSIWFFLLGQPLLFALTFAISTVVIACPDALGLATPTAVAVGTSLGAKHNILIKDAQTLEQVSRLEALILDKTGTLTQGNFAVTNFTNNTVLGLAAGVEAYSNHPIAIAIVKAARNRKLTIPKATKFKSHAGIGVEGLIDGVKVEVKKPGVSVFKDGKLIGSIGVEDEIRPQSKRVIEKLRELGIKTIMLTGDKKEVGEAVGKKLGVDETFSEVLPEDKAKYVKKLQDEGKFTGMVGDGVNDAPALAQADIGIAIGAGTDVAIETANVVLMKSDPVDILRAIRLSKATVRKMKENLFWATIYNLLAIPLAAGVLYPQFGISLRPEVSALLMSISSIIVATNAVLLKRVEKDLAHP